MLAQRGGQVLCSSLLLRVGHVLYMSCQRFESYCHALSYIVTHWQNICQYIVTSCTVLIGVVIQLSSQVVSLSVLL